MRSILQLALKDELRDKAAFVGLRTDGGVTPKATSNDSGSETNKAARLLILCPPCGIKEARHSMIVSARLRNGSGTVIPMALAVLRFIASVNCVGCSTGKPPGLPP